MPNSPTRPVRHRVVQTCAALLVGAVLVTACSTATPVAEPSTTSADARDVAEPGSSVAATTTTSTTTTTSEPPIAPAAIVHVLGSIRSTPVNRDVSADLAPVLLDDDSTIASLGCAPSTGCETSDLASWSANELNALNLATLAATTDGLQALDGAAEALALSGTATFGYGATIDEAATPAIVGSDDRPVALFGYSAASGLADGMAATETGRGILAGPDAVAVLSERILESKAAGEFVVLFIDWALVESRAPTEAELATIETFTALEVDVIVGHGSDFLQRFEQVDQTSVVYNLGNAATTTDVALRRDTALLRLTVDELGSRTCLIPGEGGPDGVAMDDPTTFDCP